MNLQNFSGPKGGLLRLLPGSGSRVRMSAIAIADWSKRGLFAMCILPLGGESHVVGYAFAGEFVGDYISMSSGRPSWVGIEAICESRVWTLERDTLEAFYAVDAAHERLGRLFAEHLLSEVYERLLQSYVTSPQDLYEILLRRCPNLLNFISLKELASFLRIRPETLSRIRRRIL